MENAIPKLVLKYDAFPIKDWYLNSFRSVLHLFRYKQLLGFRGVVRKDQMIN